MYLIRHPKTETLLFLANDPRPAGFAGEVTEEVTLEDLTGGDNMGFLTGAEINPFLGRSPEDPKQYCKFLSEKDCLANNFDPIEEAFQEAESLADVEQ
jgi:hypothetical protein